MKKLIGIWFIVTITFLAVFAYEVKAQKIEITGKVIDAYDQVPMPGVNVFVKGTTIGASTETNGNYALSVPSLEDTLVFSFIGYELLEVAITGRKVINVSLTATVIQGEEFVVVGYTSLRQRDVTGSISRVSSSELESIAQTSVNQMLRGKAAGLNLQTRSAQPGGGVTVNIRGALSPNGNNTPLYVIDGVPITNNSSSVAALNDSDLGFFGGNDRDPLSYLNPADIESINILKDASATAIYGSAAANGVILITTKNGSIGDIQVDYRGSVTSQVIQNYFPMMNERQFMQQQDRLAYDRYLFDNSLAPYGSANLNNAPAYNRLFSSDEISSAGVGTDWIDLISRNGQINDHNISMSGGTDKTRVFSSFNFQETNAVLRNSSLERISGRINVDQRFSRFVKLSVKSTVTRLLGNNASTGANAGGSEKFNMIQAALAYSPTITPLNEDGQFNSSFDPQIMSPAAFLDVSDEIETTKIFAAPNLTITIQDGLALNIVGQIDYETSKRSFYLPRRANNAQLPEGMAQRNSNTIENYSTESFFTHNRRLFDGDLSVVLGAGYYETSSEGFGLQAVGFFSDAFRDDNVGVAEELLRNTVSSYRDRRTKLSQFFRANYTFKDKYIFSLVARRDGSSIFAENNRYGIFPGVSGAWLLSEESFLNSFEPLSNLKLRLGYGLAGNESVLSGNTLQLYSPGYPFVIGRNQLNGIALSQVANPDLTWETIETINFGLDFGFFRDRISGSIDLYQRTANDLLDFTALPANNAVGLVADNIGATRSRGIEFEIKTSNVLTEKIAWYSSFNITYNKSYWHKRNPQVALAPFIGENDELSTIYGWQTNGIIQSEDDIPAHMPNANLGNIIYVDQNGDGILDTEDVVNLGTFAPRWFMGFSNDFRYGNFDLSVHMYGSLDFKINNNFAPNAFGISQSTNPSNTTVFARDIWSADNPSGTLAGIAPNPYDGNNPAGNDFFLELGNFLRISNIDLGYKIPSKLTGGVFRSARLFASMQNVGVLTNYSGFDPEFTETNPYPLSYSYTFGIDLKF